MDPFGPIWSFMVLHALVCFCLMIYGHVWFHMALCGVMWPCMFPKGNYVGLCSTHATSAQSLCLFLLFYIIFPTIYNLILLFIVSLLCCSNLLNHIYSFRKGYFFYPILKPQITKMAIGENDVVYLLYLNFVICYPYLWF